jgi:hypothetical protein
MSQSATLYLDLAGQAGQDLWVDFWALTPYAGYYGTSYNQTYVEVSSDGSTWHTARSMDVPASYTHYAVDLDQSLTDAGIDLNTQSDVYLRFRQTNTTNSYVADLYLDDVRVGTTERDGPRVASQSPTQVASGGGPLNEITLTFNEAIDPASFDGSDVVLKRPSGVEITPVRALPSVDGGPGAILIKQLGHKKADLAVTKIDQPKALHHRLENPVAVIDGRDSGNRTAIHPHTLLHNHFNILRIDRESFQAPVEVGKKKLCGIGLLKLFFDPG